MKTIYQQFCQRNKDLPIFFQDWYLDAACQNGTWKVAMEEKGGQIVGVLPYYLKKKGPFLYITMPPLTKMMGPYIIPAFRREPHFTKICTSLIKQLPAVSAYEQLLDYKIQNWLPYYWLGYQQTTRYSYVLDLKNLDQVYAGIHADYRNNKIKKAALNIRIVQDRPLEKLYEVNKMSFDRQQIKVPYTYSFLEKLDRALAEQEARTLFFAIDEKEKIHAVAYLIWDHHTAYYLLAGDNPAFRSSGAGILLTWHLIQYTAKELGRSNFDFQGSMIPSIERVRRQFGAKQQAYFFISKQHSTWFKLLGNIKRKGARYWR